MEEENGVEKNPAALSCHHCQVFVSLVCFQCFDSFEDATFCVSVSSSFVALFVFCQRLYSTRAKLEKHEDVKYEILIFF